MKTLTVSGGSLIRRIGMWAVIIGCGLLAVTGCSAVSTVAEKAKGLSPVDLSGDDKGKKLGVMAFENRVALPFKDFQPTADARIAASLADECGDILVTLPGDPAYPAFLRHPPRLVNGLIDNLALTRRARQLGFNAVATGGLIDVDGYREERGFLWFKDEESFIKLLVKMEVYDTRTGAKFLDRILAHEINMEEMQSPPVSGSEDIGNPVLIQAVEEMVAELAEEICEALEDRRWVGYVTAVEGQRVTLSSGSAQGLAPGDTLEVFDSTGTISGAAGARFFQIGPKTGEVEITSVTTDRAEGVAVGHITPGCSVTVK